MCNITNFILIILLILVICYTLFYLRKKEGFQTVKMNNPILEMNSRTGKINNRYIVNTNINYLENILNNFDISNYDTQVNNQRKYLSVYQHSGLTLGGIKYRPLGQCIFVSNVEMSNSEVDISKIIRNNESLHILSSSTINPERYELIWNSGKLGNFSGNIFSIWRPIPPNGYVCMGDIIVNGVSPPSLDLIACIPKNDTNTLEINNGIIWNYKSDYVNTKNISDDEFKQLQNDFIDNEIEMYIVERELNTDDISDDIRKQIINRVKKMDREEIIKSMNDTMNNEETENDIRCISISSHNYFRCKNIDNTEMEIFDIDRKNLSEKNLMSGNEEILNVSLGTV